VVNGIPYQGNSPNSTIPQRQNYNAALATLATASGSDKVFPGTQLPFPYFAAHRELLDDIFTHPIGSGIDSLNRFWADALLATFEATIPSVTPGTVATPTFSPSAGAVASGTLITFSSSTAGVTFYSTNDGSTPTTASTAGATRTVSSGQTIKVLAVKAGLTDSAVASAAYTIAPSGTVALPAFSPVAGSSSGAQSVTLTCATSGADIYYTDDGTTPTTSSNLYTSPLTISATTTLKAIAVKSGMTASGIRTGIFTITSAAPDATLLAKMNLILTMLGAGGVTATKDDDKNLIEVFTYEGNTFTRTSPPDGSGFSTVYEEAAE
jgi:LysM repeat protein